MLFEKRPYVNPYWNPKDQKEIVDNSKQAQEKTIDYLKVEFP